MLHEQRGLCCEPANWPRICFEIRPTQGRRARQPLRRTARNSNGERRSQSWRLQSLRQHRAPGLLAGWGCSEDVGARCAPG